MSIVAEKNDLRATYNYKKEMDSLGIRLYSGDQTYDMTIHMCDATYEYIIKNDICDLKANVDANGDYFQTRESILYLYNYLHQENIKRDVMEANPYKERYGKNNDCYVHVRLGDVISLSPGFEYYDRVLSAIQFNTLFISSDSIDHEICQKIIKKYREKAHVVVVDFDEVRTIQFASTNKYIVLSCGTFSSVIGYLSYFAESIFYPIPSRPWHGDIFCIPGWKSYNVTTKTARINP